MPRVVLATQTQGWLDVQPSRLDRALQRQHLQAKLSQAFPSHQIRSFHEDKLVSAPFYRAERPIQPQYVYGDVSSFSVDQDCEHHFDPQKSKLQQSSLISGSMGGGIFPLSPFTLYLFSFLFLLCTFIVSFPYIKWKNIHNSPLQHN